jgi:S-adenosylmethionine:tRNA ribosyltransferase-isomerase
MDGACAAGHQSAPVSLRSELFDYELPPRLIAQTPAAGRDQSRLLVVDRAAHTVAHHVFGELPQFLRAGDTLFRNTAAVLPARLHARRPSGGAVECLLLRPEPARGAEAWWCLVKPGRRLAPRATFAGTKGEFTAEVLEKTSDGTALVRFTTANGEPLTAVAGHCGDMPLPPYITRQGNDTERTLDRARYQTVYADPARPVAAAAPTAGLHFTSGLLAALATQGVRTADLTLHVGLGTFRPIATDTIEAHQIHREIYELPVAAQRSLFPPLAGRRIAVGTTSVRTIEDFLASHATPLDHAHIAEATAFIYPPRTFRGVDALITNFHQPRSTLLCLVAAFLAPGSTDGIAWLREIYAEAIAREYRFFSYGDAMLIL